MSGEKDFMIDVAKEHTYQNQNEEYYREYLKWRTDPNNKYGYKFVHDTREHIYVDGEGFVEHNPAVAERKTLLKCCSLLATAMLLMVAVDVCKILVNMYVFKIDGGYQVYYSNIYEEKSFTAAAVYANSAFNILRYLLPILLFKSVSKIPAKVALPKGKANSEVMVAGIAIAMIVAMIGRVVNVILANLLSLINIDAVYYDFVRTDNRGALAFYCVCQYIIVPLLLEILFRGYFLQCFRQFGDFFAILITSLVNCMSTYHLSEIGYVFCISVFMGLFTVRSGSVKTACIMRLVIRSAVFWISYIGLNMSSISRQIMECAVCIVVLAWAIYVYHVIIRSNKWTFNINSGDLHMTLGEKLKTVISGSVFDTWLLAAVAVTIVSVRFIA